MHDHVAPHKFLKVQDKDLDAVTILPPEQPRQGMVAMGKRNRNFPAVTPAIHEAFVAWRAEHPDLTNREIAAKIGGISQTAVSKYTNQNFDGDLEKVEGAIKGFLERSQLRSTATQDLEPFETSLSRDMLRSLKIIASRPQIGILHGHAGEGKTSAIQLCLPHFKGAIHITVGPVHGSGGSAVQRGLWEAMSPDKKRYHSHESQGVYLARVLRDSPRLIIIDDAHELGFGGRKWVKHFFDLTKCSIALVGNPVIVKQWSSDPQQFRRIGLNRELSLTKGRADGRPKAVEHLLAQLWPGADAAVLRLCNEVAAKDGRLGSVWMQVSLAKQLLDMDASQGGEIASKAVQSGKSPEAQAFRMAHSYLVRDYKLTE